MREGSGVDQKTRIRRRAATVTPSDIRMSDRRAFMTGGV
jgi:hypothetical protein